MAANPMTQFYVYRIGPEIKIGEIDISFTNASLFMLISAISISIFLLLGTKDKGYRALTNIGSDGGQEVPHLHFHIFAGEKIGKMVS